MSSPEPFPGHSLDFRDTWEYSRMFLVMIIQHGSRNLTQGYFWDGIMAKARAKTLAVFYGLFSD